MPITGLIRLQSKCTSSGYLTYLSLPLPDTKAINTACNIYLQMLGLLCNISVHYILQTSPKIRFSYVSTHGTIQATHSSLVPWSNPAGSFHLVGAHTDSIQVGSLFYFPAATFDNLVLSIAPKNTVALFHTCTDATLLPDIFASAMDPTSQVGSETICHDDSFNTVPQFVLIPLLWPNTLGIPVNHPINSPFPKGSYDKGFTTWLAAIHFLATRNQMFGLHTQHSLFAADNWSKSSRGHTILDQLGHKVVGLSTTTVKLNPLTPIPECHVAYLPFIDDTHLSSQGCQSEPTRHLPRSPVVHTANTQRHDQQYPQSHQCPLTNRPQFRRLRHIQLQRLHATDEYTIILATLSPVPKALFQYKPAADQTDVFNAEINCVANHCRASNLLPFVNITRGQFDRMFVHVVTNYVVMHAPLKQNSDILDLSLLLVFNFVCIPHSNDEFHQCTCTPCLYKAEVLYIDKATHHTCHSETTLFVNGSQMAYSDELITGHNFLLFLPTLSCNVEHNLFYKGILSLLHLFHSPCVQTWVEKSPTSTHMSSTASSPSCKRPSFEHNAPLHPNGFQMANSIFSSLICLAKPSAYGNHLNPFTSAPTSFLWWPHHKTALLKAAARQKSITTPSNKQNSKRKCRQSTASNPAAGTSTFTPTASPTPTNTRDSSHNQARSTWDSSCDQAQTQGLFVLKSGAAHPYLDEPTCASITASWCKFFHATTWAKLSDANKNHVTVYVNASPAVDFSPSSSVCPAC
eukprot:jgi/Psemu1/60769/gm1.60769_g